MRVSVVAAILIAVVARGEGEKPRSAQELMEDAIDRQEQFCANPEKHRVPDFDKHIALRSIKFMGKDIPMYASSYGDPVSEALARGQFRDAKEIESMIAFLGRYSTKYNIKNKREIVVLDAGSNMGIYALGVGLQGYSVVCIEAVSHNVYMLRKTFCMHPEINVLILDVAVGDVHQQCGAYSPSNDANGILSCDGPSKRFPVFRNYVQMIPMDYLTPLNLNIVAAKIDVEGCEHKVIRGGRKFLFGGKIKYFQFEISPHLFETQGESPREFLRDAVQSTGYPLFTILRDTLISISQEDLMKDCGEYCDLFFFDPQIQPT